MIQDYTVADLEKKLKRGGWIGMKSTGRWSNGLGSLNPKCYYEYQEMRGGGELATLFTPPESTTDMLYRCGGQMR